MIADAHDNDLAQIVRTFECVEHDRGVRMSQPFEAFAEIEMSVDLKDTCSRVGLGCGLDGAEGDAVLAAEHGGDSVTGEDLGDGVTDLCGELFTDLVELLDSGVVVGRGATGLDDGLGEGGGAHSKGGYVFERIERTDPGLPDVAEACVVEINLKRGLGDGCGTGGGALAVGGGGLEGHGEDLDERIGVFGEAKESVGITRGCVGIERLVGVVGGGVIGHDKGCILRSPAVPRVLASCDLLRIWES